MSKPELESAVADFSSATTHYADILDRTIAEYEAYLVLLRQLRATLTSHHSAPEAKTPEFMARKLSPTIKEPSND